MGARRVLLLLSGRPESVSFARSVCGLLGAGARLGPWPTHRGLQRVQVLLLDRPFPGASARLPQQVVGRAPVVGSEGLQVWPRGRTNRPYSVSSPISRSRLIFKSSAPPLKP